MDWRHSLGLHNFKHQKSTRRKNTTVKRQIYLLSVLFFSWLLLRAIHSKQLISRKNTSNTSTKIHRRALISIGKSCTKDYRRKTQPRLNTAKNLKHWYSNFWLIIQIKELRWRSLKMTLGWHQVIFLLQGQEKR